MAEKELTPPEQKPLSPTDALYEAPVLHDVGKAEDLIQGNASGNSWDNYNGWAFYC